ncbi:DUF2089 domain-containing protein [Luteococcus sp. OSA5]|uniref:DUF2089 domain-containing protein n=1 Tax=Luteococcus sp. OSA5 TaxID=3401630 RepID=UPI003B42C76E
MTHAASNHAANTPAASTHRAPADCPVCSHELITTRLGCAHCGTELAGRFERCGFCALNAQQAELLTVFLASRGNLREVAKAQQVSYPTARARLSSLLQALGIEEQGAEPSAPTRAEVLAQVEAGELTPAEAARLL